jgi:hypothetical protein
MRARRLAVGLAACVLGIAVVAPAQELSVSAAAGIMIPSGASYREIYGSSFVVSGDVWFKFKGPFGLATGFSRLSDSGLAVGLTDLYPLEFRRQTVPLVLFYRFDVGPVDIRLGAGAGFHSFKETWQTVDLEYSGTKTAPRYLLAVSVEVVRRVSLFCSLTYDPIHKIATSPTAFDVKLGGAQAIGGLSFRIF